VLFRKGREKRGRKGNSGFQGGEKKKKYRRRKRSRGKRKEVCVRRRRSGTKVAGSPVVSVEKKSVVGKKKTRRRGRKDGKTKEPCLARSRSERIGRGESAGCVELLSKNERSNALLNMGLGRC